MTTKSLVLPVCGAVALLLLAPACSPRCTHNGRASATPGQAGRVRCEVESVTPSPAGGIEARFRVVNDSGAAFEYHGFTVEGPIYHPEVQVDGAWQAWPVGWCGTGMTTCVLRPGETVSFSTWFPADGRSYRFHFGEPPVTTPAVP